MKKIIAICVFISLALVACGQITPDHDFKVPIRVVSIIFPDSSILSTANIGVSNVTWETLAGKPATYPSDWETMINKPGVIELKAALEQLGYLPIPTQTTAEINATVVPVGEAGIVYDATLEVYKVWAKTYWKILITAN